MDIIRLLMRAKRLAQRPPSARQAAVWLGIIAVSLLIAGAEWMWGWPDWLTPDRVRMKP